MNKFQQKNFVLTKKINNSIYELMVKSVSDMIYVDDQTTLTEKLADIIDLLATHTETFAEFKTRLNEIVANSEDQAKKLKDVWEYVNANGDPKSELIKLIDSKVTAEDGKGLSSNDFTTFLKEKLENDYTKEELNEKFTVLLKQNESITSAINELKSSVNDVKAEVEEMKKEPNIRMSENAAIAGLEDGNCWFQIIKN